MKVFLYSLHLYLLAFSAEDLKSSFCFIIFTLRRVVIDFFFYGLNVPTKGHE